MQDYLTLLQYPNRPPPPSNSPNAQPLLPPHAPPEAAIQARVKPVAGTLELSVPLQSSTFDRISDVKAKRLGRGLTPGEFGTNANEGNRKGKSREQEEEQEMWGENNDPLERMTMRGDGTPDQTNYCVGVFKDGRSFPLLSSRLISSQNYATDQLHLSPLTSTVQVRPSLHYLDAWQKRERQQLSDQKRQEEEDARLEQAEDSEGEGFLTSGNRKEDENKGKRKAAEEPSDLKTLSVTIRNPDMNGAYQYRSGRGDAALFAPYYAERQEPWQDLTYYDSEVGGATIMSLHRCDTQIFPLTDYRGRPCPRHAPGQ